LQALEQLASELGPGKLLLLEYHNSDMYSTVATQAAFLAYGVTGTPTVFIDGNIRVPGGSKVVQDNYNMYRSKINPESAQPSPAAIVATKSFSSTTIQISVQLTNISTQPLSGIQLSGVTYTDLGKSQYRAIVNDISSPITANLAPGETQNFQLTLARPASVVQTVVLLKSGNRLLQGALAK
jgi:hypothetical protein